MLLSFLHADAADFGLRLLTLPEALTSTTYFHFYISLLRKTPWCTALSDPPSSCYLLRSIQKLLRFAT